LISSFVIYDNCYFTITSNKFNDQNTYKKERSRDEKGHWRVK